MHKLGHRTLIDTFECTLTGVTVEMVRPGRRHKRRASAIVESEWEGEAIDLLKPPKSKSETEQAYIEYLQL